ncbi:MAG: hypothetical protein LBQ34_07545 [Alphaproteobacteria bacterium]|jgi:hypothetical protein|nr:hypothetical protein [Alphaproteobacteria bacterium]
MSAQIFTSTNSKITLFFRDTKFTMLGYESASFTDNLLNEISYDPTRQTSGMVNLKGGVEADQLSITTTIEDSGLINLINELFNTREVGLVMITHKEDVNRILTFEARVKQRTSQSSIDDSTRSKLIFNFSGKLVKNTF